jgi:hypothetical protein
MPSYTVHRFDVVRVSVEVTANSDAEAMAEADKYLAQHNPIHQRSSGMEGDQYATPKWLRVEHGQDMTGTIVLMKGEDPSNGRNYDKRGQPVPSSCWDEHPQYPRADWQTEVENGDTVAGYVDWVSSQLEQAELEKANG